MSEKRERIQLFDVDVPRCSRTYGVAPCTAALGVTGTAKCFNTRASCQDPEHLDLSELIAARFAEPQVPSSLASYGPLIPSLVNISTDAMQINLGGMEKSISGIGMRETITVRLNDHRHSDLLFDKYRLERHTGQAQASAGEVDIVFTDGTLVPRVGAALATITFTRAGATATRVHPVERYVYFDGGSQQYIYSADSAANSVTGDLDVRMKVALNDWTPAANAGLARHWGFFANDGNDRSWDFRVNGSGTLCANFTPNGLTQFNATSTVAVPFTDGQIGWVRFTRTASDGVVRFYTSTDGVAWTQLGSDRSSFVGSLWDSSDALKVGISGSGGDFEMIGKFYRFEMRSGVDGAIVSLLDVSSALPGDTTFTSELNEPWTANNPTSARVVGAEIETVAADTPRFDYDPVTLECKGLLVEEARTNLLQRSAEFDDAYWSKGSASVTANAALAPDGTMTADYCVPNAGTALHYVARGGWALAATPYTFSVYAKPGPTNIALVLALESPSTRRATFNFDTGTVSGIVGAGTTATMTPVGGGWYRCALTIPDGTGVTTSSMYFSIYGTSNQDGVNGTYYWGAQLEAGSFGFATSYIPTTSAAVTRNADTARVLSVGAFYNEAESTFVVEGGFNELASNVGYLAALSDGGGNFLAFRRTSAVQTRAIQRTGGVVEDFTLTSTAVTTSDVYRAAIAFSAAAAPSGSVNGVAVQTGTVAWGGRASVTQVVFGNSAGGGSSSVHVRRFTYYPKRLSNAALQELSAGAVDPSKYITNAYDPYFRGSFWPRFLARNPYYASFSCRVYEGYVGDAIEDMRVRNYVIDTIDGPANGEVTIKAKDLFSLIEKRKAQAPPPTQGELAADLTGTPATFTLAPAGIGDSEYGPLETLMGTPGAGHVAIGRECIQYTRVGDVMTVVLRKALGTQQEDHKEGDVVQWVLSYSVQAAHDVFYHLLTNFSAVPSANIPKAAWDVSMEANDDFYSAHIAKPTPVSDLIGELEQQAAVTLWPDVETGLVQLRPLRAGASVATLDDDAWFVDGGQFAWQRVEDKRISDVLVHYGQISPLEDLEDDKNYRSHLVHPTGAGLLYGTDSLFEIYSRWIPEGGRTFAQHTAKRVAAMFENPPLEATFPLHASRAAKVHYADYIDLAPYEAQDFTGAQAAVQAAVVEIERDQDLLRLRAQQVGFVEGDDGVRRIYLENSGLFNVNLRAEYDKNYPAPEVGTAIEFIVLDGINIGSLSSGLPAMRAGSWPAGVVPKLINHGRIQGIGGQGGRGGDFYSGWNGYPGGTGGDALVADSPIEVDNTDGEIWAGGGGAGGGGALMIQAENSDPPISASGFYWTGAGAGGAAGNVAGSSNGPGVGSAPAFYRLQLQGGNGGTGTIESGAGGGTGATDHGYRESGNGGTGGNPGLPGSAGETAPDQLNWHVTGLPFRDTVLSYALGAGGAPGNPGRYVVNNSNVTWIALGDVRGSVG